MSIPIIGITTVETSVGTPAGFQKPVVQVNQSYVNLIPAFGGLPVLLTSGPEIIDKLQGLLIIGGQDIEPVFYGANQEVTYQEVSGIGTRYLRSLDYAPNKRRDEFELELYRRAKAKKIPILGICRGLQLINIAEGGSLYQELPESSLIQHETGSDGFMHAHVIKLDKNSRAYKLMQTENYMMSSSHHQGIERLGTNLRASAWAEDGLIEIIESDNPEHWVMGVQGHIEQTRKNYKLYDRILEDFLSNSSEPNKAVKAAQ